MDGDSSMKAPPTTTILGAAGVTIATPTFLAIYSCSAATIGSTFFSVFAVCDASIMAGDDVALQAVRGSVSIKAYEKVDLFCGDAIDIKACANAATRPVGKDLNLIAGVTDNKVQEKFGARVVPSLGDEAADSSFELTRDDFSVKIGEGEDAAELKLTEQEFSVKLGKASLSLKADGTITIKGKYLQLKGDKVVAKSEKNSMILGNRSVTIKRGEAKLLLNDRCAKLEMGGNKVVASSSELKVVGQKGLLQ